MLKVKFESGISMLSVRETVDYVDDRAQEKVAKSFLLLLAQGILAGMSIAFGAIGYVKIYSMVEDPGVAVFLGATIFPMGIIAVVFVGAELFTSNCMATVGYMRGHLTAGSIIKMLMLTWLFNLIGAVFIGYLAIASKALSGEAVFQTLQAFAEKKTHYPIDKLILSGILCNLIVCLAVWMSYRVKQAGAKVFILWFPITLFVISGSEHIVANMFYLSAAYFADAPVSLMAIGYNFLFVTIGNFIGGGLIFIGLQHLIVEEEMREPVCKVSSPKQHQEA